MLWAAGVLGVVAWLLAWLLAGLVYFAAPYRLQNRFLSLVLFAEGAYVGSVWGFGYLTTDFATASGLVGIGGAALLAFPALALLFLSTLTAPLTRLLRLPAVRWVLGVAAAGGAILSLGAEDQFIVNPRFVEGIGWAWDVGPWLPPILGIVIAVTLYGLMAAVSYYRAAPAGSVTRRRAKMYLLAFAVHDASYAVRAAYDPFQDSVPGLRTLGRFHVGITIVLFALILGYGILRTQLFGIDLRLKWSIRRGTVVIAIAAVALAAAQAGVEYLGGRWGWVVGGIAAGIAFLFLRPLERVGTRLSQAALPAVRDTSEYRRFRKLDLYREALEGLLEDGSISEKERRTLQRLQSKLSISPANAKALEADVRRTFSGRPQT